MKSLAVSALFVSIALLAGCAAPASPADTDVAAPESDEVEENVGIGGRVLPTTVTIDVAEAEVYIATGLDDVIAAIPVEYLAPSDGSESNREASQIGGCHGGPDELLYATHFVALNPETDVEAFLDELFDTLDGVDGWIGGKTEFDPGETTVHLSKESGLRVDVRIWNETLPSIGITAYSPCLP